MVFWKKYIQLRENKECKINLDGCEAKDLNIDYLSQYNEIVNCIHDLNVGDYVILKDHPRLEKRYAGCVRPSVAKSHDNVIGWVVSYLNQEQDIKLYSGKDLIIAVSAKKNNKVTVYTCDSRLFHKLNITTSHPCKILRGFIDDIPILNPKLGQFVRPRKYIKLTSRSGIKSQSTPIHGKSLLSPLIVVKTKGNKITLAGSTKNNEVYEIVIDSSWNLICTY